MPRKSMSAILRPLVEQGIQPTAVEVLAAAEAATLKPVSRIRCLNPECTNFVTWTSSRGRPKHFCSPACHRKQKTTKTRLLKQLEALETLLTQNPQLSVVDKRCLGSKIAHHRWALRLYPDFDWPSSRKVLDTRSGVGDLSLLRNRV